MRLPVRSASALALCVAALLAAPGAAAAHAIGGQLVVQGASFEAPAEQAGTLAFLVLYSDAQQAPLGLHLKASHIEAHQFDADGYEVHASDLANVPDVKAIHLLDAATGPPAPTKVFLDDAALDLAGTRGAAYALHLIAQDAAVQSHVASGRLTAVQNPQLDQDGINEGQQHGATTVQSPFANGEPSTWSYPTAASPHVLTDAQAGTLRITGTFVLEASGLDFAAQGSGTSTTLRSGITYGALAPGGIGPADQHLRTMHEAFLRIFVTDGVLDLAVPAVPHLQWSGPAAATTVPSVTMTHANGFVRLSDGEKQTLDGASYVLDDGRYTLQSNPSQQGLQLAVTGLDANGNPLAPATATVRPTVPALAWAIAAAVVGATGVTLLAVALLRRNPTMADVETALEAGHFRRAARDAARLLQRRPGFEDAMISRAVALSKLGRNRRVVREIRAHFAAREPSDGVLHYVLGLALRETGATADAQEAWREALRRTPGLLPQVQPLLAGQQASSRPSAVPTAVDGTAYA